MDVDVNLCGCALQAWFCRHVFVPFQCHRNTSIVLQERSAAPKNPLDLKQLNHLYVDLHNERSSGLDCNHFLLLLMTDPEKSHNTLRL